MTTQDNIIINGEEKTAFLFHHLNRLIIVGLSTIALAFDDYQTPDIFYGISIIIWLWLSEIELFEQQLTQKIRSLDCTKLIKQISIILLTVFIVITFYLTLDALEELEVFVQINQALLSYDVWIFLVVIFTAAITLFYSPINWLIINNPVDNIRKEFRHEGAVK